MREWGLQNTGVISQPQGICTAANWVFIGDRQIPIKGLLRLREYAFRLRDAYGGQDGGQAVRETDWAQVRDIALPTDACGSLINLVRYGHRPPEKELELGEAGEVLKC